MRKKRKLRFPLDATLLNNHIMTNQTDLPDNANDENYKPGFTSGIDGSNPNDDTPNPRRARQASDKDQNVKFLVHRRLKFFFMDPLQKWKIRKQFPWKLTLQLIKIIIVTAQIAQFATNRYTHVVYFEHTQISFKHLFLENWDSSREVISYPPSNGIFAIYTIDEFYKSINYAINRYFSLEKLAVGSYDFPVNNISLVSMELCELYYTVGKIWAFNHSYVYNSQTKYNCTRFYTWNYTEITSKNFPFNFDSFLRVDLIFQLNTVHIKSHQPSLSPDCYSFEVKISYDNSEHSGHLKVNLDTQNVQHPCHGKISYPDSIWTTKPQIILLNIVILIVCSISLYLCIRALIRANKLKKDCVRFFRLYYSVNLSKSDRLEFLNLWYVTMLINDLLIIVGTVFKLELERKLTSNQSILIYDICGILLGCGCLLVWIGILRYLKFFAQYNVLLITIKKAIPNVIRYLVCGTLLYLGFLICGWVVLSPYHSKFQSFSSSSECLFSLINGDDMYATFIITNTKSTFVWWFSRIYFYTFNALFIYVVINLFISVILDTYESIKEYWDQGHLPQGFLMDFIAKNDDFNYLSPSTSSGPYVQNDDPLWKTCIACCFHRRFNNEEKDIKHLLSDVEA